MCWWGAQSWHGIVVWVLGAGLGTGMLSGSLHVLPDHSRLLPNKLSDDVSVPTRLIVMFNGNEAIPIQNGERWLYDGYTLSSWCNSWRGGFTTNKAGSSVSPFRAPVTRGVFISSCEATGTSMEIVVKLLQHDKQYPLIFPVVTEAVSDTIIFDEHFALNRRYDLFADYIAHVIKKDRGPLSMGGSAASSVQGQQVVYLEEVLPLLWGIFAETDSSRVPYILTIGAREMRPLFRKFGSMVGGPFKSASIGVLLCLTRDAQKPFVLCKTRDFWKHSYLMVESPYVPFPVDVSRCQVEKGTGHTHIIPSVASCTGYAFEKIILSQGAQKRLVEHSWELGVAGNYEHQCALQSFFACSSNRIASETNPPKFYVKKLIIKYGDKQKQKNIFEDVEGVSMNKRL